MRKGIWESLEGGEGKEIWGNYNLKKKISKFLFLGKLCRKNKKDLVIMQGSNSTFTEYDSRQCKCIHKSSRGDRISWHGTGSEDRKIRMTAPQEIRL